MNSHCNAMGMTKLFRIHHLSYTVQYDQRETVIQPVDSLNAVSCRLRLPSPFPFLFRVSQSPSSWRTSLEIYDNRYTVTAIRIEIIGFGARSISSKCDLTMSKPTGIGNRLIPLISIWFESSGIISGVTKPWLSLLHWKHLRLQNHIGISMMD